MPYKTRHVFGPPIVCYLCALNPPVRQVPCPTYLRWICAQCKPIEKVEPERQLFVFEYHHQLILIKEHWLEEQDLSAIMQCSRLESMIEMTLYLNLQLDDNWWWVSRFDQDRIRVYAKHRNGDGTHRLIAIMNRRIRDDGRRYITSAEEIDS